MSVSTSRSVQNTPRGNEATELASRLAEAEAAMARQLANAAKAEAAWRARLCAAEDGRRVAAAALEEAREGAAFALRRREEELAARWQAQWREEEERASAARVRMQEGMEEVGSLALLVSPQAMTCGGKQGLWHQSNHGFAMSCEARWRVALVCLLWDVHPLLQAAEQRARCRETEAERRAALHLSEREAEWEAVRCPLLCVLNHDGQSALLFFPQTRDSFFVFPSWEFTMPLLFATEAPQRCRDAGGDCR